MLYTKQFLVITILLSIISCKKELNSDAIAGKWNIITDSSYQGVAIDSHFAGYTGKPGDYFNFDDGKLYIQENNALNTSDYHLISNNSIAINSFISPDGEPDTCTIMHVNDNDITISSKFLYSPGGGSGRKVHLTR